MLSARELIDEIEDGLNMCIERNSILKFLNRSTLAVASTAELYLPDLLVSNYSTRTLVGKHSRSLPSNFNKKLTSAYSDGRSIRVYGSVSNLRREYGDLGVMTGMVSGVATQGRTLFYQNVPAEPSEVIISYYRSPLALEDSEQSFPEGTEGAYSFPECLVSHVMWKVYAQIEDGLEGQKVNTGYYKNEYRENLEDLKDFCSRDAGPDTLEPGSEPTGLLFE